jgi:membrane-bound serine protease (ClpP class)
MRIAQKNVFFLFTLITAASASAGGKKVVVIKITGEVDLGMVSYIERAIETAEAQNALILLHVNTFGGRIDAATEIRDAIMNARVPLTIAFVDKRAISAGALITLACKKIVMAPGSLIGAVTPVDGSGTKASEKVVSYMRAEMRSTAERNGRNPDIASAMVDETIKLDTSLGIKLDSGKLLTLSTNDAKKVGYLDAEANSIQEVLASVGVDSPELTSEKENFSDKLIRFLTLPLVSSLLIMTGLGGLFYTIKTGHFGSITVVSILSLVIFFGGQYITEVAPALAVILFILGIGLLIAELFIPSFGIIGVLGILSLFGGLFLALTGDLRTLTPERLRDTLVTLAVSLVGFFVIAGIIFRYAPGWPMVRKLIHRTISGDISSIVEVQKLLLGKEGQALTALRPAGTALIGGKKVDVVTQGEFIAAGSSIAVINISGNRTVVKQS